DELERIIDLNGSNPKHPVFLAHPNNRRYCRLGPDNFFFMTGREQSGRAVTLNTAKLLDHREKSFADTFADGTFLYDEPGLHAQPDEHVSSSSVAAAMLITGAYSVFSGTL